MWETKSNNPRYALYHNAIEDGLAKLVKYYSKFDNKVVFVLALGMLFLPVP